MTKKAETPVIDPFEAALGVRDARDAVKSGLLTKEGGRQALDHYFHQVPSSERKEEKAL